MSHHDFVLGYENGVLGCGVSGFLALRLFLNGRIREKRLVINWVCWFLGLAFLIGLLIFGSLCLPGLFALLGAIYILAVFGLGFTLQVGELIILTALANKGFYDLAIAERVLWIFVDDEGL